MNLYPLVRPILFSIDAERAHYLTLRLLGISHQLGLHKLFTANTVEKPITVMGLTFTNLVGLAAGLDKNGDYIDPLAGLGFGFLEIGTVTPRPQIGNPKPRLFRLPEHQAIINRMGFNNDGIDHLLNQVARSNYRGVLGINIGKNADTPIENAINDYLIGLRKAATAASYVTLNISSPNTKNLRQLQQEDELKRLIGALKEEQLTLRNEYGRYVPLVLKIAPDLSVDAIEGIAKLLLAFDIDGVIATNTTLSRDTVRTHPLAHEAGGLSGAPLFETSTQVVKVLADTLNKKIPIIAAGGIFSAQDAQDKLDAGASLVQIYSGFIYQGTQLIDDIARQCHLTIP